MAAMSADELYPNWKLKLIFAVLYAKDRKRLSDYQRNYYHQKIKKDPEAWDRRVNQIRRYCSTERAKNIRNASDRRRRSEFPGVRLAGSLRGRINEAISGRAKFGKSKDLIGCSMDEYKTYLESLFKEGMTWDNYGNGPDRWNIDHNTPLAAHDMTSEEGQKKAFHYTNTKPEWADKNTSKSSIYNGRRWYYRDHIMLAPATV